MKILYLSLRFPYPPHSGDKIRTYNILKHLSPKHSITFASFVQAHESAMAEKLHDYCDRVITVNFSSLRAYRNCFLYFSFSEPFQVMYWKSEEMQRKVDRLIEEDGFEVIHVQFFRMAQYVTKFRDKRKLLDSGDSFWLNLSRRSRLDRGVAWPLLKVEANKVRIYETEIAKWFDAVTMVSPLDRDYMLSRDSGLPVSLLPMGVDLDYYQPSGREPDLNNILFTGTIRYFPNKDAVLYFYNEIFPLIKSAVPSTKFYVVGNNPPKSVLSLASNDDIVVTGRVEDVRPYFDRSAVFVCPVRSGSGMQTKILEAMAMGVPVVTTSMGSVAFEDALPGRDIVVADDARTFAQEVIRLLKDSDLRQTMAQNARRLVEERYGWPSIINRLDAIYESIKTLHA